MRERLASRLGFILLTAGCAIGIGNVWRFPYVAGQSGGGWFVLIYLFFLAVVGIPVLVMEFASGRASQRSIVKLHAALTPGMRSWRLHGLAGFFGNVVLMMFYTTVSGWMVLYFFKTSFGAFGGMDARMVAKAYGEMLGDPWQQAIAMVGVSIGSSAVCAIGLQRGLERVTKWMMLALLVLIVLLSANSVCLEGGREGLKFFLFPDFARLKETGVLKVIVNAMNQSFFTLSLGIGAMALFGSYVDRKRTLLGEALHVAVLDTVVALCAGLIIIPACFAYRVEPSQGPGLIFVTLPNVFNHMPLGRFFGALFFAFMSFAALSTVLTVFETIIACVCDYTGFSRGKTCALVAVVMPLLSLPCVLGFNVWSSFRPFGLDSCVLDLEDFVVSNLLLPLGAIAFAFYCCHSFGWGWRRFLAESNEGTGPKVPSALRLYCAYVLPIIIAVVFVIGLVRRFA